MTGTKSRYSEVFDFNSSILREQLPNGFMREQEQGQCMPRVSGRPRANFLILIFLVSIAMPLTIADGTTYPVISVDWLDHDEDGNADHSYIIDFNATTNAADFYVKVTQIMENGTDVGSWNFSWDDANLTISPINLSLSLIQI